MAKKISQRQKQILDFITSELKSKGFCPSIQEIGRHIGANSTSTIHYHISELMKKGELVHSPGKSRSLMPAGWSYSQAYDDDVVEIPVVGEIAAGQPVFAYEDYQETVKVARSLISTGSAFVLKVRGKSMIEDLIDDGDMVVVRKQNYATDGDIVVALIENEAATLKRIYREKGMVRLQPANSEMAPLFVNDVKILGRVISVIRPMERKARILGD